MYRKEKRDRRCECDSNFKNTQEGLKLALDIQMEKLLNYKLKGFLKHAKENQKLFVTKNALQKRS